MGPLVPYCFIPLLNIKENICTDPTRIVKLPSLIQSAMRPSLNHIGTIGQSATGRVAMCVIFPLDPSGSVNSRTISIQGEFKGVTSLLALCMPYLEGCDFH